MAEVWRAVHVAQQVPVAVKVITKTAARDPLLLRIVRNEVEAAARLDHPGIVMVLDYGEVPEDAELRSNGALTAGSPYIAMELASWGSLDRLKRTLEWPELSRILLGLLDALAHAHARGVLHRDLKPANILVSTEEDLRPGIKLTDFGIAHALEQDAPKRKESIEGGTPLYMAPEQFVGEWRDFGPWTDLYAVGCLTWFFATGKPLFTADNTIAIGVQHIRNPPPPFVPKQPMPKELESWVLRLLAKDPADRFQRAADAAWALARIHDDVAEAAEGWGSELPPVESGPATLPWIGERFADVTRSDEPTTREERLMKRELPPLPFSWRAPPRAPNPPKLLGAGLGLYGIRKTPLVDRDGDRDLLWSRLSRVRDGNRAEVVLISGAAGTGKSRLVEWICERADEVGGATVMKAFFGPMKNPSDAIAQMMERSLRVEDLDRESVRERVERTLRRQGITDEYECNALAELILRRGRQSDQDETHSAHFSTAVERSNLVQRFFARSSEERPVIVWFDDVQFGADALIYARQLLDAREQLPCRVLVLMTMRDDLLVDRSLEQDLVEQVASREGATLVQLGPLGIDDQRTLVHELLGLEPALAADIAQRTAGNPLFAVQLVDDWVRRGVLELDESGFRLKEDETADLPGDVQNMWLRRIDDLLRDEPAEAIVALEIAAVLGQEIDRAEWSDTCERCGISIPTALLASLVDGRLFYPVGVDRWAFAHNMLRESLEAHAKERRRWESHHRASAEMLASRYGVDRPGISERIGRHFLESRAYAEALSPLYWAALERWIASDHQQAQFLLEDYERTLASIAASNSDPRWPEHWVLRARIARTQGRYKEAIALSERARDVARYFELDAQLASALVERAMVAHTLGDPVSPRPLLEESERLALKAKDEAVLAVVHLAIADLLRSTGELSGAQDRYRKALDAFRAQREAVGTMAALHGLGSIADERGDREGARRFFQEELESATRVGNRHAYARAKASIADLLRFTGNLGPAERAYREAIEISKAIGTPEVWSMCGALGLLLLEGGDPAAAHREMMAIRPIVDSIEDVRRRCYLHAALAADAAAAGRWVECGEQLSTTRELIDAVRAADARVARTLELVAETAHHSGHTSEADQASALARRVWLERKRRNPSAP